MRTAAMRVTMMIATTVLAAATPAVVGVLPAYAAQATPMTQGSQATGAIQGTPATQAAPDSTPPAVDPVPAVHASGSGGGQGQGPRPLLGDVIIFNDEIIEPVSLPISTCGGLLPLLSSAPSSCEGASRVSDDDA